MNDTHQASVVTKAEWAAARLRLLEKENELTRARDALAADRRPMPWLKVDQEYLPVGPRGTVRLPDLFDDRRQLLLYRAFFEPGVSGQPDHACTTLAFTALGRQQDWDDSPEDSPEGSPGDPRFSWLERHDEYTFDGDAALG